MSETGQFVWHDLMTHDTKAAIAFYTALFGWKTKHVDMGPAAAYTMLEANGRDIGGVIHTREDDGPPPRWIAYATTGDVDALARRAERLGGSVPVPPTDIPHVGRFAVIGDPQGAHLSPIKLVNLPEESDREPSDGDFCWDELLTTEPQPAYTFYAELFGWERKEMDLGPMGKYILLRRGAKDAGGIMRLPPNVPAPPHWMSYVRTSKLDELTLRARALGGKIIAQPLAIPGFGRVSIVQDPTGAILSLYALAS